MNRYYDDPFEDVPRCAPGKHPSILRNGRCTKCGVSLREERESILSTIPKSSGKHKKEENNDKP